MSSKAKTGKRSDKRPARARYWGSGRLAFKKIRNLIIHGRMTVVKAMKEWESTRKRYHGADLTSRQHKELHNVYEMRH